MLLGGKYPEGESETLEFKAKFNRVAMLDYSKCIVAFANTRGGKLVLGVSDDRTIRGMPMSSGLEDEVRLSFDRVYQNMIPDPTAIKVAVTCTAVTFNLSVITVEVVRSTGVHPEYHIDASHGAYKRLNASTVRIVPGPMFSFKALQARNHTIETRLMDTDAALELLKKELALEREKTAMLDEYIRAILKRTV